MSKNSGLHGITWNSGGNSSSGRLSTAALVSSVFAVLESGYGDGVV